MAGGGHSGFCKLCDRPEGNKYVQGAREGWNFKQASEVAATYGFSFARNTWFNHKRHAMTAEQRVMQAADKIPDRALTVRKTSNQDFLEAVRDIGMRNAQAFPGEVTLDHALKAVQIMEAKKEKPSDAMSIVVAFITNNTPAYDVIDGEAREVEGA